MSPKDTRGTKNSSRRDLKSPQRRRDQSVTKVKGNNNHQNSVFVGKDLTRLLPGTRNASSIM